MGLRIKMLEEIKDIDLAIRLAARQFEFDKNIKIDINQALIELIKEGKVKVLVDRKTNKVKFKIND